MFTLRLFQAHPLGKQAATPLLAVLFLFLSLTGARAQCPLTNTAFKGGERLEYKLFFNWKFIWVNAGTATMTTEKSTFNGQSVYKSRLITRTSKRLDKFFCMRDTLLSIITPDLVPLYYRKGANEGGKYRLNEVHYTYPGGNNHLELYYRNPYGNEMTKSLKRVDCVYDMMSMMLRARSFDGSQFKEGERIHFLMADGKDIEEQTLVYRGIKKFKTEETKITYRCMVFSFVERKGKKEKEIITFYITDDANHLPVRLDMFLKFGVAKAYLKTSTGVRNPETSIIKN